MSGKDADGIAKPLRKEVEFARPMDSLKGKVKVLDAAKNLSENLKSIPIQNQLGGGDPGSAHIARHELFFDTWPFENIKSAKN